MPKRSVVVTVVAVLHFALEFVAWSIAPGNTASGQGMAVPWRLLSFPVFALMPASIASEFFLYLLLINSVVFGLAFTAAWQVIRWTSYSSVRRRR
jgi:hypothetical protein